MYENNYAQIPTYEQALMIANKFGNFNFKETKHVVDGYNISTFSYFLCDAKMFLDPLGDNSISAINMRGITYVFNKDNTLYKTYLMLPKFFNLNQTEITSYDVLKNKKIVNVDKKHDGSLISFIKLPNGKVVAKTINSFDNEQTLVCNEMWDNRELYFSNEAIKKYDKIIEEGNTLCFEYVSPSNKIVLEYENTELKELGVRCNITGKWIPFNSDTVFPLDYFVNLAFNEKNIEGWVLQTEDGLLLKIKTIWYCNLHGLYTEDIYREDKIIYNLIKNDCDDFANLILSTSDKFITTKINIIRSAITQYKFEANLEVAKANYDYNRGLSVKDIAIKYKNSIYFYVIMCHIRSINATAGHVDIDSILNDLIIKKYTNKLSEARNFVTTYRSI